MDVMDEIEDKSIDSLLKKLRHKTTESENQSEVVKLFAEICRFDGHLIPIPNMKSRLNEPLLLMTRLTTDKTNPGTTYFAIDVVARRNDRYVPVGMKDYEIRDGIANGNMQCHNHFSAHNDTESAISEYWQSPQGLRVREETLLEYAESLAPGHLALGITQLEAQGLTPKAEDWDKPIYQNLGIANLMTAVAIVALRYLEIEKIRTISVKPYTQKILNHYGAFRPGDHSTEKIASKPKAMEVIHEAFDV